MSWHFHAEREHGLVQLLLVEGARSIKVDHLKEQANRPRGLAQQVLNFLLANPHSIDFCGPLLVCALSGFARLLEVNVDHDGRANVR